MQKRKEKKYMKKTTLVFCIAMLLLGGCKKEDITAREHSMQSPKTGTLLEIETANVGRFGDDIPITRGEMAKMIALAFYMPEEIAGMQNNIHFTDVSVEDWYYPYINVAVKEGYLSGEGDVFLPEDNVTLQQAQALMDRLNPDNETKITINEENKNKAVAYSLWLELFIEALQGRRAEDSLFSYGIQQREQVLLDTADNGTILLMEDGIFTSTGRNLQPLENKKVKILTKEREIVAIEEIMEDMPVIENAFFHKVENGIEIDTGDGAKVYEYADIEQLPEDGIADIQIEGDNIVSITVIENGGSDIIKKATDNVIELENNGVLQWADNAKIYEEKDGVIIRRPVSRLISGTDIADFYYKDGKVAAAVIRREAVPKNIRVLLSDNNHTGYEHKTVILTSDKPFSLKGGDVVKTYQAGEEVVITPENDLGLFENGRVYVTTEDDGQFTIKSISRNGVAPQYRATLELEKTANGFTIVNEVPFETYLKGVVPFEMPVSFGLESLKVQAISARSYAYNQFFENRFGNYGAHVDDSTNCQVYNGSNTQEISDRAVEETEGLGVTYGDRVVNANFYSTSAGVTANSGEVWAADNGKTFPSENRGYLISKPQGLTEDTGDLTNEENAEAFFKNWEIESYDSQSPWFRWKVTLPKEVVNDFSRRVQEIYDTNHNLVEVLQEDGTWKTAKPSDLGAIQSITIAERGQGGNAMFLAITGEHGSVRIKTEYAIRNVLRPVKAGQTDVILQLKDGSEKRNYGILPSAFIVLEEEKSPEGLLESVTIYGGGNGHGAGMSQYGAKAMAEQGFDYTEILQHYFEGAKVQRIIEKG